MKRLLAFWFVAFAIFFGLATLIEKARADTLPVQRMIASHVSHTIGAQWVSTALRIAKIESGFRCNAYNKGAHGIFQVRHPARFGVSSRHAMTCAGGIAAGVNHMRHCLAIGARTAAQMMRCHNSGSPYGRVERAYRIALRE